MPVDEQYRRQVALLVRVLPFVAEENCFALKGGTAINLFIRNLPRLSVDIDLAYLPVADRAESLRDIETALCRIQERVEGSIRLARAGRAGRRPVMARPPARGPAANRPARRLSPPVSSPPSNRIAVGLPVSEVIR